MSGALKRDEWETVRLGDYISLIRGVSYSPKDVGDDSYSDYLPVLRANNIRDDMLNFDDLVYVHISKINNTQLIKSGDILVCASSGSKQLVGKSARATQDYQGSFGAFCKLVRTHDCIDSKYLGHYFGSEIYRRNISDLAQGANINNLRNEHIENILLPLPPLDVQRRIADTLDKVSELITLRKTQLKKLDELVKARFVELFGDVETLIHRWDVKRLAEVTINLDSTRKPVKDSDRQKMQGQYPYYGATGIVDYVNDYRIDGTFLLISEDGKALEFRNKDIAFIASGKIWVNNHAHVLQCTNDIEMIFLKHYMNFRNISDWITGIDQKKLNRTNMDKIPVGLPPITLQKQFSVFVEQIDKLKSSIQQSLDALETLQKSLMQEYFG